MKRFSTFEGVFTPSVLSILGVIMYLRLGWVVGQVGIGQALVIVVLANLVTLATALSMSSIVTNIRIGAGGAYSIITKSLGIEVGGAIGIPLYLSQAISVAFYIVGFTECWLWIFPQHNFALVSIATWAILLIISYTSAKLVFRIQFIILGLIVLSLISIFLGHVEPREQVMVWHHFNQAHFWKVFAVFFPAVTGFLAGATMSGELTDSKKSIPRGTLAAIGVGFVVYTALAVWFILHVTPKSLVNNTNIIIDLSKWRWMVLAGIMGATFSSALSMFVASPRTLFALGKHRTVPFSKAFSTINKNGEPTSAILLTGLLSLSAVLLGTLNDVAGLLTMFFLITYGMINLSVFIEQSIGLVSFRPTFRVARIIPLLGTGACFALMFFINAQFSLVAAFVIIVIYWILIRRGIRVYNPDVRSGLLVFGAEQLAKAAGRLPYYPKIWKPNLLVSVDDPKRFADIADFLKAVVLPGGRIIAFKVIEEHDKDIFLEGDIDSASAERYGKRKEKLLQKIGATIRPLKEEGIFATATVVESSNFSSGTLAIIQTLKGTFFPPNTLFLVLTEETKKDAMVQKIIRRAEDEGLGVIVLLKHEKEHFKEEKVVNLWIRRRSPNIDLSVLIALQLQRNWDGFARIVQVVKDTEEQHETYHYLAKLKELMRMPMETELHVVAGDFRKVLKDVPPADINIFGMPLEPDIKTIREIFKELGTSVLFLRDSEHEKATA